MGEPEQLQLLGWQSQQPATQRLLLQCDEVARAARTAAKLQQPQLAAQCAAAAGWAYLQRGPYAEGKALLQTALQSVPQGPLRAWLHFLHAHLELALGEMDSASQRYQLTAELASEYGLLWLECDALRLRASTLRKLGRLEEIRPVLLRAREVAQRRAARDGQAEFVQSAWARLEGDSDRERVLRKALALARQAGNLPLVSEILVTLSALAQRDGRLAEARARLELQAELGILGLASQSLNTFARLLIATLSDDDAEVERLFPLAQTRAAKLGDPLGEIAALVTYAAALLGREDLPAAQDALERAEVLLGQGEGFERPGAEIDLHWAELYERAGRFAEALPLAQRAADRFHALGEPDYAETALNHVALHYLALGQPTRARETLERCQTHLRLNLAHHLAAQALLARAEGHPDQMEVLLTQARQEATRRGHQVGEGHGALIQALFGSWAVALGQPKDPPRVL
jgi:tetratricopeptide (TPR) repeat protein